MTSTVVKPNIFRYATNELSQDVFIAWIIRWADPSFKSVNVHLHHCGIDVLSIFLGNKLDYKRKEIIKVETKRQWKNIDIWVKVSFQDGGNIFLIIEDKTFSGEHSGQLERYQKIAGDWAGREGFILACAYFKTGSEPVKVLKAISDKGFLTIGRSDMLNCLNNHRHIADSFVSDYIDHLQFLEDAHSAYLTTPLSQWKSWAWVGFYQFVESQIDIHFWHKVNNQSGGFWNLCLTWGYWQHYPVYIQIEEEDICYKMAIEQGRKASGMSEAEANRVQDFVFRELLSFAKEMKVHVRKPKRYAHAGKFRTFAIVPQEIWMGDRDSIINPDAVLSRIKSNIEFYHSFLGKMRTLKLGGSQQNDNL